MKFNMHDMTPRAELNTMFKQARSLSINGVSVDTADISIDEFGHVSISVKKRLASKRGKAA